MNKSQNQNVSSNPFGLSSTEITDFPTLSCTSTSEIPTLSWPWGLYKVPLSGAASPYRPLWEVPPGSKHYSRGCRKNIPNQVIKCSRCERYNNREGVEGVARKATTAAFSMSSSLLFIHVPTMSAYILNIYAGFSLRIQVAGGRCNITGEYYFVNG